MADYTRLTNLEVTGELKVSGLTKATYTVTSDNATAAAGSAPTAAEFLKVVTLANELKEKLNKLASQVATGSDT